MSIIQHLKKQRKLNDKFLFFSTLLVPLYLFYLATSKTFQANLFENLIVYSGHWSLGFYALSYAISPCQRFLVKIAHNYQWQLGKRLSDWNFLFMHRRTLGIAAFTICTCHFVVYFYFELGLSFSELVYDLKTRYFLLFGFVGFAVLSLLFVTSFHWAKKRLGYKWQYIHNLTHIVAFTSVVHIVWLTKVLLWYHYGYILLLLILFAERVVALLLGRNFKYFEKRRRRHK